MTDEEVFRRQEERFRQFLKCLDGLQRSVAKQAEAVQRQAEMTALLFEAITKKEDGLIDALDDAIEEIGTLRTEINALRRDFPKFLRAMQAGPIYRRPGT
ncbi:MAG: hypothetical protein ACRD1P_11595 [Thermoanaerobaculia bacterium]